MNLQQDLEQEFFVNLIEKMAVVHFQGPEDHTCYCKGYYNSPDSFQFTSSIHLLFTPTVSVLFLETALEREDDGEIMLFLIYMEEHF